MFRPQLDMIKISDLILHIFFVQDPDGHPLMSKRVAVPVAKQEVLC